MKMGFPLKVVLLGAFALTVAWFATTMKDPALVNIHKQIQADFPSVEHINADDYANLNTEEIVVFDVREPEEFAVSHLDGAIRVDPEISPDAFSEQIKDSLKGKTAVFYCSVGWRSSDLANRVSNVLEQEGVAASYNLSGGLFQWHNDDRPLMAETGDVTDAIHPFDADWGQLIKDQGAIQYGE